MATPNDPFALADWRRQVAEIYAAVRHQPDPKAAWDSYRAARVSLFKGHPQSPLRADQQHDFVNLPYFPYDPAWRIIGRIDTNVERETLTVNLPADGEFRYTRIARIDFVIRDEPYSLSMFWIDGYGGGLFLPFKDLTAGQATYGGGRYLYDAIKGADLAATTAEIVLDFNFAYNPSCAYNDQWICPLSPPENRLTLSVEAGEQVFRLS